MAIFHIPIRKPEMTRFTNIGTVSILRPEAKTTLYVTRRVVEKELLTQNHALEHF